MNEAILIGNVGADPEIKSGANDSTFATLRIATSKRWKDKDGQKQERTEWHNLMVNGGLVKVVEQYVQKGDRIAVRGEIRYREHDGKYYTTIHVRDLEMLGQLRGKSDTAGAAAAPQKDDIPF